MEKSKRTFRGSYPAYALTYFFFYWSLGVFTSVLSMYLTGIGKSKAEMSFIMSASSLFGVVLIPIVGYINDKLRKPRLICTVMMACVAVFGILFALVRETMLLFLLNGCIMGFISSLSPVSERMATSTKYRYGTIRIWGTFGYAAAVQVACAMMEFTSPQLIFVSVSVSAVLAIVVMYDASHVRKAAGEQAKILNYMMEHWTEMKPELFGKELKELLGHTPIQVFAGAVLGVAIGFCGSWLFL